MNTIKIPALATTLLAASVAASQAASVSLDFSTAAQYDNNFVETVRGDLLTHNSTDQNVRYATTTTSGSQTSIARYDTLPGNGMIDNADFLTETIGSDFSFNGFSSTSAGLFTRIQSNSLGILGLMNPTSGGASIQLRLFYGANSSDPSAGTAFFNATFNLTNGSSTAGGTGSMNSYAENSPIFLTLTQTSGIDPVFSLTASDSDGLIATTGLVTLTATESYNGAGAIGFRVFANDSNQTIRIDNFTAVPEPSAAILGAFGALALLRRRR